MLQFFNVNIWMYTLAEYLSAYYPLYIYNLFCDLFFSSHDEKIQYFTAAAYE